MADRTRPQHYPQQFCVLCGRSGYRPGHNRKERQILRESRLRDTIRDLFMEGRNPCST